jgi:superfamily II DNA or RNA helicase
MLISVIQQRDYQLRTVASIVARWRMGPCRIACVAPTGAGKTTIAQLVMNEYPKDRWGLVCHTRDLAEQSRNRTTARVFSIQGLLQREELPPFDRLILDECHHYAAEEWLALMQRFTCPILGLTATPMRADGLTLRPLFDDLTVAAHYSELLQGGYIVPMRTLRPKRKLERGIATDPVAAYLEHGEGRVGFCFGRTIEICQEYAERFSAFGVPAACVDAGTDPELRKERLAGLGTRYRILTSVYALTEGVDVPAASVCILGRGCGHPSLLLQMAGRVMRPAPGKTDCLLLDLPGVTWVHGTPQEDREYSLDGITRSAQGMALRVCQKCGYTEPSGAVNCTRCGFRLPPKDLRPKLAGEKLIEATAGNRDLAQQLLLSQLLEAKRRGYHDDWIVQRYKQNFGKAPELPFDADRRMALYEKYKEQARANGYSMGYAAARWKAIYGAWPPRSW